MAQAPHKDQSLSLATALHENLNKLNDATECRIRSAPLVALEGADMPAVLIEIGHVTHPATEKNLRSPQGLASLARAITLGLKAFVDESVKSRRASDP